jgi:catechol 2,3-dioxygenase-like lactoylglutathione lyase family enzyme
MTNTTPRSSERRLHHVALGSADVERLAAFYRLTFGLVELQRFPTPEGGLRSIWLDLGGAVLMIERTDEPPRRVDGVGAGPFLLAFQVSPAERWQIESALERAGVPIESRTSFTSYTRDPDSNRIAFSHYPEPAVPR